MSVLASPALSGALKVEDHHGKPIAARGRPASTPADSQAQEQAAVMLEKVGKSAPDLQELTDSQKKQQEYLDQLDREMTELSK